MIHFEMTVFIDALSMLKHGVSLGKIRNLIAERVDNVDPAVGYIRGTLFGKYLGSALEKIIAAYDALSPVDFAELVDWDKDAARIDSDEDMVDGEVAFRLPCVFHDEKLWEMCNKG